jgi:DNA-binding CsgD family transcriptional regulator
VHLAHAPRQVVLGLPSRRSSRVPPPARHYLVAAIETELRAQSLPTDTFSELEPESVRLAKTASRRTLGFMNETDFELRYFIANTGGIRRSDIGPHPRIPPHATKPRRIRPPDRTRHQPARLTQAITSTRVPRELPKHGSVAAHTCRTRPPQFANPRRIAGAVAVTARASTLDNRLLGRYQWSCAGTEIRGAERPRSIPRKGATLTAPSGVEASAVRLSPRQQQVLDLLAEGCTDAEIARELGISARTVRMHVDALRAKFGVTHRRRLLAIYRCTHRT